MRDDRYTSAAELAQCTAQLAKQFLRVGVRGTGQCPDHDVGFCGEVLGHPGTHMTQAAGHAVSNHRGTHRLADNQSKARSANANHRSGCCRIDELSTRAHYSVIPAHERVYDQISPPDSLAAAHRPGEVGTMMQPIRLRQHPSVRE